MSNKGPKKPKPKPAHERKFTGLIGKLAGLCLGIVTLIGADLTFRPQVAVNGQSPLQNGQPFSVPFQISNAGSIGLYVEKVYCYEDEMQVGGWSANGNIQHEDEWGDKKLERGGAETILCSLGGGKVPSKADIVILVSYHVPWWMPWDDGRYSQRFTGTETENWQWLKQPTPVDVQGRAVSAIEKFSAFPVR